MLLCGTDSLLLPPPQRYWAVTHGCVSSEAKVLEKAASALLKAEGGGKRTAYDLAVEFVASKRARTAAV